MECSDAHLIGLVVAVLEEVPEEGEDLSGALVVHVPHASHTQYDCLTEGGRREREMEGRGGRGREGRGGRGRGSGKGGRREGEERRRPRKQY